jgi:hypothetical protein
MALSETICDTMRLEEPGHGQMLMLNSRVKSTHLFCSLLQRLDKSSTEQEVTRLPISHYTSFHYVCAVNTF